MIKLKLDSGEVCCKSSSAHPVLRVAIMRGVLITYLGGGGGGVEGGGFSHT